MKKEELKELQDRAMKYAVEADVRGFEQIQALANLIRDLCEYIDELTGEVEAKLDDPDLVLKPVGSSGETEKVLDFRKLIGCRIIVKVAGYGLGICATKIDEVSPSGKFVKLCSDRVDEECPGWCGVEGVEIIEVLDVPKVGNAEAKK